MSDARLAAIQDRLRLLDAIGERQVPADRLARPLTEAELAAIESGNDRALLAWIERAAPRIALDGPRDASELEGVAIAFELVAHRPQPNAALLRTLGYLHLREQRWEDAGAAFARAAATPQAVESEARLALDRARLAVIRGAALDAVAMARSGLVCAGLSLSTQDELRDVLERAYAAAGRSEDALAILDARAAECGTSLELHHRLAREWLARNDVGRAGAVLERAARMPNILGDAVSIETRVPACFEPIIDELRGGGRYVDADALLARSNIILDAN